MKTQQTDQPKRKRGRPQKMQVITEAQLAGLLPLDYMLAVIRDPTATQTRRDRMAIAAAPYCHARRIDARQTKGKKDKQAEEAWKAGMGTAWMKDLEFENRRDARA